MDGLGQLGAAFVIEQAHRCRAVSVVDVPGGRGLQALRVAPSVQRPVFGPGSVLREEDKPLLLHELPELHRPCNLIDLDAHAFQHEATRFSLLLKLVAHLFNGTPACLGFRLSKHKLVLHEPSSDRCLVFHPQLQAVAGHRHAEETHGTTPSCSVMAQLNLSGSDGNAPFVQIDIRLSNSP